MTDDDPYTIVTRLIRAARAAARCREAAIGQNEEVAATLHRAAARYSDHVTELAGALASAAARQ